ncbi:MAG: hypothetical protein ACI81W_003793, partial [Saprospiraceae bacterium]
MGSTSASLNTSLVLLKIMIFTYFRHGQTAGCQLNTV